MGAFDLLLAQTCHMPSWHKQVRAHGKSGKCLSQLLGRTPLGWGDIQHATQHVSGDRKKHSQLWQAVLLQQSFCRTRCLEDIADLSEHRVIWPKAAYL